jgi:D-alanine-D-alanine ligase
VIGIVVSGDYEFFDFEAKYDGSSQEICNPTFIEQDVQAGVRKIARKCHDILGCQHLSRVDIMLDNDNNPFVIEVNTMPGLTDQSLFPKAAAYAGLTMPELVEYFIKLASESK